MSSISGNFYPEIMVWMCNNANNPDKLEAVRWLQNELDRVDPFIHQAYPLSSKYFLQKRGLSININSRVYVHQLTKEQVITLDNIYEQYQRWCTLLKIDKVVS
jgi:4-hydroxy-tetrahydrodipicolinate synthase